MPACMPAARGVTRGHTVAGSGRKGRHPPALSIASSLPGWRESSEPRSVGRWHEIFTHPAWGMHVSKGGVHT
eukprot:365564-Chlamydomonas_euryale.AAC.3